METGRIHHLLEKFLNKTASAEEQQELWAYVEDDGNESIIKQFFEQGLPHTYPDSLPETTAADMLAAIVSVPAAPAGNAPVVQLRSRHTWRWAAAVLAFLLVGGAAIFITTRYPQQAITTGHTIAIMPGTQKATLTLGDGSVVALNKTGDSAIQQGNTLIKNSNATLLYAQGATKEKVVYNRLTTPRGGQYQVQLADGTKVWLNAASSLYYPTAFTGNNRTVEVTGEAYFEVASNAAQPFFVQLPGKQTIAVLGTAFNVNAYADEKEISTTLVTGAVQVNAAQQQVLLKPGQQLRLDADKAITTLIPQADIAHVTAWKNGAFSFNGTDLKTVMRQVARWYDIEVSFEGAVPPGTFKGEIGMDLTLQEVLDGLAESKIRYKIVNKEKIIIYP